MSTKAGRRTKTQPRKFANSADMQQTKFGYLSAMELFADLPSREVEQVSAAISMRTCPPGTVCYIPGETGEVMFLLKKGTVQIYRLSPEGRKLIIARLEPFSFFGEMSILGQGMNESFAETESEAVLCAMSRADVERHIFSRPQVVKRILDAVGRRMLDLERMLEDAAFRGLVPRIASLLLRETRGDRIEALTHQSIADRLGVYRESATLALHEMKKAGIIETGRKRITIIDREALERAARDGI